VTPEATEAVCEKMMPGFGELMRQVALNMFQQPFYRDKQRVFEESLLLSTFRVSQNRFVSV